MVRAGLTSVRELAPEELALLPSAELERTFGSARRRREHLCGRALLRRMLQDWTGKPAAAHRLQTTAAGKPVCVGGPAISITHAGDRVACGIADRGEIGVDLEAVDLRRDTRTLARRFFSSDESAWLASEPADRFYMLWVLKEAYVKAVGASIFSSMNRLRCRIAPPDIDADADSPADLALYVADGMFFGIATTSKSLRHIRPEYWPAGGDEFVADRDFALLAARYGI